MRDRELKDTPWEVLCFALMSRQPEHVPVTAFPRLFSCLQDAPVLSASYDDVVSIVDLVKSLSCTNFGSL